MKKKQTQILTESKVKWIKSRYQGVYYRESQGEKIHNNKPDRCFFIRYKKDGKRIMEKVGWAGDGYSAETAKGIRSERIRAIWHGEELPKEKAKTPLFSETAESYLKWAKENKSRDTEDKGRYNKHLKDPLGKKRLNEISSFDLEKLKSNLFKKGLAPATVKHCLALVREIFNKAREWGKYQGEHPLKGVKMPSLQNRRERFLSHEEADLLLQELAAVKGKVTHDQALLSLHCGLRAGEIFNLRGQDLDFERELFRIMDAKNKESRTVYMTQAVKEILKARVLKNKGEFLFSERGTGTRVKEVSQTFDRAVEKLGLNGGIEDTRHRVVFHTLRHTFGSWLAIQGTPILTIKELMGHKTLVMTERYAHLIPDVKRNATLDLERTFEASRKKEVIPIEGAKAIQEH